MTKIEAHECATLLAKLFPQADLQDEEIDVFMVGLLRHEALAAQDAIRQHRLTARTNRPHFNAIFADLNERRRKVGPGESKIPQTFAEIVRRGNPSLASKSDAELVLRFHRHWWFRSPKSDALRESVARQCVCDLVETGMEREQAQRCAAFVFDDKHAFEAALDDLAGTPRYDDAAVAMAELIR